MQMNVISEELSKGKQTVTLLKLFSIDDIKLRIKIVSDAYKEQCYAKIEVFSKVELKWNYLHSMTYDEMNTPIKLYCHPYNDDLKKLFKLDVNHLTAVAKEILK